MQMETILSTPEIVLHPPGNEVYKLTVQCVRDCVETTKHFVRWMAGKQTTVDIIHSNIAHSNTKCLVPAFPLSLQCILSRPGHSYIGHSNISAKVIYRRNYMISSTAY